MQAITGSPMSEAQASTRRHPRVPVRLRVYSRDNAFPEEARDLSLGGMSLETGQLLPAGSKMEFELEIPQRDIRILLVGEVAWVKRDGARPAMGIRFSGGSELHRQLLANYLDRLFQDFQRL